MPSPESMPSSPEAVVFLACSERSGSNLIRVLMDAHPHVYSPAPMHLAWLVHHAPVAGDLRQSENWDTLVHLFLRRFQVREQFVDFDVTREELTAVEPRTAAALYLHIHMKGAALAGKRILFLKENHTAELMYTLSHHFPQAKYVFQVRDPRDVVLSAKKLQAALPYMYPPPRAISVWEDDQAAALRTLLHLPDDRRHVQRYEDLVERPEQVLSALCEFIGVPLAGDMLSFHESSRAKGRDRLSGWRNLGRPIMASNTKNYTHGLRPSEICMIERQLKDLMVTFGYELEYPDAGAVRRNFSRLARYAWWLWAFVTRRMPPKIFLKRAPAELTGLMASKPITFSYDHTNQSSLAGEVPST